MPTLVQSQDSSESGTTVALDYSSFMSNLPLFRDPWAKREAWRKNPIFGNRILLRNLFPGFGIAVVAFTAYVVADNIYLSAQKSEGHHH